MTDPFIDIFIDTMEPPPMTGLLGIDISNNNPGANMAQAKAQGVSFCVGKCSQGWAGGPGGWMDWTWVDVVTRARAAGILPGGYHWGLKGNGAAQAQQFVASLKRAGGPKGFLCGLDIERNDWDQTLNIDPATVDAFLAEWDALTNRQPLLLYGAPWYHDDYMHAGARWPTRPLWVAQYTSVSAAPIAAQAVTVTPGFMTPFGGWTSYAIRQFTDNAQVGGEAVDANITYLTLAQLQSLTQPGAAPVPIPTPTPGGDLMATFEVIDLNKAWNFTAPALRTIRGLLEAWGIKVDGKLITPDDSSSDRMRRAVAQFQTAMGLKADLVVGPSTYAKLCYALAAA